MAILAGPTTTTTPSAADSGLHSSSNAQRGLAIPDSFGLTNSRPGSAHRVAVLGLLFLALVTPVDAQRRISDDRDLKEINLAGWDCLNRMEGTAKNAETGERNKLKNRSAPKDFPADIPKLDFTGFQKYVAAFDNQTKGRKRNEIYGAQKQPLPGLESQLVEITAYLGNFYCGPPETTNCGSSDFHDWHLEVFAKPPTRAPAPGDPTAIVCEITPRTQNAIFKDGIRLQELGGFFRDNQVNTVPTGHPPRKVRITGYLLWDDEHNGSADVGESVASIAANKFHNPWRKTAWEIHPVIKIESADEGADKAKPANAPSAAPAAGESPSDAVTPTIAPTTTPGPTHPHGPLVTITQAIQLQLPTGNVMIPVGTKFHVRSNDAQYVNVEYLGAVYPVPIGYTDWQ